MSSQIKYNPKAVCDYCGKFGAYDLGDHHLCSDCYCERGSCCLEFGGHDMWEENDDEIKKKDAQVNKEKVKK